MRTIFSCLFFVLLFISSSGQDLHFYKENITMKIDHGYFYVTGIYYLKSERNESEILFYPYPVDSIFGAVDSIYFYNMTTNQILNPLKTDVRGTIFNIDFGHYNDQAIQISYRQKLRSTRAEYILKSTIGWKESIVQADYQLIVPSAMRICHFSIPPRDSITTAHEIVYLWKKNNYMPSENLIFDFIMK